MHALKPAHYDCCLRLRHTCATKPAANMPAFQGWWLLKLKNQGLFTCTARKAPCSTVPQGPDKPSQFRSQASVCGGLFLARHLATCHGMRRATLALCLLSPYGRSC